VYSDENIRKSRANVDGIQALQVPADGTPICVGQEVTVCTWLAGHGLLLEIPVSVAWRTNVLEMKTVPPGVSNSINSPAYRYRQPES
jgi:hypothetical protein